MRETPIYSSGSHTPDPSWAMGLPSACALIFGNSKRRWCGWLGSAGLGKFGVFVAGEPALSPSGFFDHGEPEDPPENVLESRSERKNSDESKGIGSVVRFDDDK
jgi:hypothetical protein